MEILVGKRPFLSFSNEEDNLSNLSIKLVKNVPIYKQYLQNIWSNTV